MRAGEVTKILDGAEGEPGDGRAKAKFILATDGEDVRGRGPGNRRDCPCPYKDFPDHSVFLPLAGIAHGPANLRESRSTSGRPAA